MVAAFFPQMSWFGGWLTLHGLILFVMTFFGSAVAIPVAWILKKTLFQGETPPFVMELPSYKMPSPRIVLHRVLDRAQGFCECAGTLILATSILIWLVSYFPASHADEEVVLNKIQRSELEFTDKLQSHANLQRQHEAIKQSSSGDTKASQLEAIDTQLVALNQSLEPLHELYSERNQISARILSESYLGQFGKLIEPIVKPLGWDWKIGVGVIASFPAREVIVSTLGTIYSLGGDVDESSSGLQSALQAATWPDGRRVYSIPVAISIMVFFALCAQCASTLMVIRRETNHWGWALFTFVYMTILAYVGAWIAFTLASLVVT